MTNKMTIMDQTNAQFHRSHIIIRETDGRWIAAEFDDTEQLDFFAQTLGFTYALEGCREIEGYGTMREYKLSHRIEADKCGGGFWKLEDLPEGVKPIKALSNGHIVTCYFTNDGETIRFYRPNPNASDVYHPMGIEDHIAHRRIYGSY